MMPNKKEKITGAYTAWIGTPVCLKLSTEKVRTSLLCTILGESEATLRVRISGEWDVDIFKEMVLAVDPFPRAGMHPAHNHSGERNPAARSDGVRAAARSAEY